MNNKQEKQILNTETRHGQVAGQSTKPLDQEFIMNNFNTNLSSDQLNGKIPQLPKEALLPEDLGSDACPWLDEYVNFSRIWSPQSFDGYHEACGLSVLSTVAAGRVVFDLSGQRKTNLNILLVGRTSVHAKSTASNIAKELLSEAGLDWLLVPDDITPQKLISDMSTVDLPDNYKRLSKHDKQITEKRTITAGQRSWYVDEFGDKVSAMMQPNGTSCGIKGLIRTLDGSPKKYENRTIGRGGDLIKNPYLTIFGNITVADLVPYAKRGNTLWQDGFFARFALVTPPNDNLLFGTFPNELRVFPDTLVSPIVKWNEYLGLPQYEIIENRETISLKYMPLSPKRLIVSQEVYKAFNRYHKALRIFISESLNKDLDGNYARYPEMALRIAAIFASLEQSEIIQLKHWAKAQAITERWRYGLHQFYQQVTDTTESQTAKFVKDLPVKDQIIRALVKKVILDKRGICQFTGLTNDVVEPAISKLESDNKIYQIADNGNVSYMLTS